ncbi:MAG: hypothetical protein KIT43_07305 [Bauldia sp.]|nr:hypothetical protein [Bauldia sp.]MCW5718356.1 hypothetical protein [Bauldia sp.]
MASVATRRAGAAFGAALALGVLVASPAPAQDATTPMFPLLTQRVDEVAEVWIQGRRYTLDLRIGEDGTVVDASRGNYPTRADLADRLVENLAAFERISIATDEPLRYGFYDVEGPSPNEEDLYVRVIARNGDVLADAIVGAATVIPEANRSATAVRNVDEADVWFTTGFITMPQQLSAWFDPVLQLPGRDLSRIVVSEGGVVLVDAVKQDFTTGAYAIAYIDPVLLPPGTPGEGIPADDNALRSLAQSVVGVVFESTVPREEIDVPEGARMVRYETTAGYAVDVTLAHDGETTWVLFDASLIEGAPATAQALVDGIQARTANWAFRIPVIALSSLLRSPAALYVAPPIDFAAPPM